MSVFPVYAQNIVIATILIVAISGASIGVILGGRYNPPIYVDREQVQKDLQGARKFKIDPMKRIVPLAIGLVLIGISFVAVKYIGDLWLSTDLIWWGILSFVIFIVGVGFGGGIAIFALFPHYLVKEPQNVFKRLIRKLIRI